MNGAEKSRAAALDAVTALGQGLGDGTGLAFLMGQSSSPSRARLQKQLADKFPKARWTIYEPVDLSVQAQAASAYFGQPVDVANRIDQARTILSLDCDFIGTEETAHDNIRRFSQNRSPESEAGGMNRLYSVESLFTLTGLNADHRLRVPPSLVAPILARLAAIILGPNDKLTTLGASAAAYDKWISVCAKDLQASGAKSLVMVGHRLPMAAHVLALAVNEALGALGATIEFLEAPAFEPGSIADLAKALAGGEVQTLVVLGGNPAYDAPVDLNWKAAQAKAKTVVRLGYHEDETSWDASSHAATHWDIPETHFLESWGDARCADGTLVPVQPLIDPLFGGVTELEILATLAGAAQTKPYDIVRETFRSIGGSGEDDWKKFLHDGFLANSGAKKVSVHGNKSVLDTSLGQWPATPSAPTKDKLEVVFYRDLKMDDGRHNNNGWLQEMPDPITKVTWDNAIVMSPQTAEDLGVYTEELRQSQKFFNYMVEVKLDGRTVRGSIWIQPGMADNTIGLALGYGRTRTGRVGTGTGFNAYALRTSAAPNYASGASAAHTEERSYELATTQSHWSMEGRPAVREANLDQFRKDPNFANKMDLETPKVDGETRPDYPNPFDARKSHAMHQWGMAVDLNKCVGCAACTIACQSENNIPIVGKEMVGKSREMHWIRIDRYYAATPGRTTSRSWSRIRRPLFNPCSASTAKPRRAKTSAPSMRLPTTTRG